MQDWPRRPPSLTGYLGTLERIFAFSPFVSRHWAASLEITEFLMHYLGCEPPVVK